MIKYSKNRKKPSTQGAWALVEGVSTIQPAIILSRQSNYNMVEALLLGGLGAFPIICHTTILKGSQVIASPSLDIFFILRKYT